MYLIVYEKNNQNEYAVLQQDDVGEDQTRISQKGVFDVRNDLKR